MRKSLLPILFTAALPLGGCTTSDMLGGLFGNDGRYGQGGQTFDAAAAEACAYEARRYGAASVSDVRQVSSSTMRVYGTIQTNNSYGRRAFQCDFREDGRITDFDID